MARAAELAEKNTPGVAAVSLGILLENLFLGTFAVTGWIAGRVVLFFGWSWFHGSKLTYAVGLAVADGYKKGSKPQPRALQVPQQSQPGMPPFMDDGRAHDVYSTPFGVPFGPNVQAYSEHA